MNKSIFVVIVLISLLLAACPRLVAQQPAPLQDLFLRLQSDGTTDAAANEFMDMHEYPDGALYLTQHLAAFIHAGPRIHSHAWENAVHLAGAFRIKETAPPR